MLLPGADETEYLRIVRHGTDKANYYISSGA
jgi:hypothetical protein